MRFIVHADDFGYDKAINKAIINLCDTGVISSVSVMANMPFTAECVDLLRFKKISIGLHSTFTQGKPVSDPILVPSLIDNQGFFLPYDQLRLKSKKNQLNVNEISIELNNQFNKIRSLLGGKLSLLDCHQGLHTRIVEFKKAFLLFGKENKVAALRSSPHYYIKKNKKTSFDILQKPSIFNLHYFGFRRVIMNYVREVNSSRYKKYYKVPDGLIVYENLTDTTLLTKLTQLNLKSQNNKTLYVEVHPAINLNTLQGTEILEKRVHEYEVLSSISFKEFLKNSVSLISFNDL